MLWGVLSGKHWRNCRRKIEVDDGVDRQVLQYLLSLVALRPLSHIYDEKAPLNFLNRTREWYQFVGLKRSV